MEPGLEIWVTITVGSCLGTFQLLALGLGKFASEEPFSAEHLCKHRYSKQPPRTRRHLMCNSRCQLEDLRNGQIVLMMLRQPVGWFSGYIIDSDSNLNWKEQVRHISLKISRITADTTKLKHLLPQNVLETIYKFLIRPHFNYRISIWGS